MKKLMLLILLMMTSLLGFSQSVTDSTSIQLKKPIVKLVIKDLILGDGLKKELSLVSTKVFLWENKIVLNEEVNIDPHLKHNKILFNQDDGYSKSRDLKRVASIPTLALSVWAKEYNGDSNWFALPSEVQNKILKKKLNSSEFQFFKTAEGNL